MKEDKCKNCTQNLYNNLEPAAKTLKVLIQMLIGLTIVVLLALKLLIHLRGVCDFELAKLLVTHHPLEIVAFSLAVSAGVELAYMLFTPGPDEAIGPLILGMSSAILLVLSRDKIVGFDTALTILVLTGGIGFLFWVKRTFIDQEMPNDHTHHE